MVQLVRHMRHVQPGCAAHVRHDGARQHGIGPGGGANAVRMGATACTARSRNREYRLLRAQSENATSLLTESTVAIPEMSSGYQNTIWGPEARGWFINRGNRESDATMIDANMITNHGITWTKTIVFRVARLLFLESAPRNLPRLQTSPPRRLRKLSTGSVRQNRLRTRCWWWCPSGWL